MHDCIQQTLKEIETSFEVRILYACESGSRGWGFESQNSDWDVRFIYCHPRDWYLAVDEGHDVIELPVEDDLDANGWDFRKSLRLLKRSNPSLCEWLSSPLVYREESTTMAEYRDLAQRFYRPLSSFHHYLQMAKGNFRDYLKGEEVWLKKYLYVLRPVLACRWIERGLGAPPMRFFDLMDVAADTPGLAEAIRELVALKKAGAELDFGRPIPTIQSFLIAEFARLQDLAKRIPKIYPTATTFNDLDVFFRRTLEVLAL